MEPNLRGAPIVVESHKALVHVTRVVAFVSYSRDSRWMRVGGRTISGPGRLPKAT